jgi:hypothetical protein
VAVAQGLNNLPPLKQALQGSVMRINHANQHNALILAARLPWWRRAGKTKNRPSSAVFKGCQLCDQGGSMLVEQCRWCHASGKCSWGRQQ